MEIVEIVKRGRHKKWKEDRTKEEMAFKGIYGDYPKSENELKQARSFIKYKNKAKNNE